LASIENVIQFIVSMRDEEFSAAREHWTFFSQLLRQLVFDDCFEVRHVLTDFLWPFFPNIVRYLYDTIPAYLLEDGQCTSEGRAVWSQLVRWNGRLILDFLKGQPPSPALYYALANFPLDAVPPKELSPLYTNFIPALRLQETFLPEYATAILYALARGVEETIRAGPEGPVVFAVLVDFAFECLLKTPDMHLASAAVTALSMTEPTMLPVWRKEPYISRLCGQSETYLTKVTTSACGAIFAMCGRVVATQPMDAPLVEVLRAPLAFQLASHGGCPEALFAAIRELAYATGASFFEPIEQSIWAMARSLIASCHDTGLLEAALSAVAALIIARGEPPVLGELISAFQDSGSLQDGFFRFFAVLRAAFPGIENAFQEIEEAFVLPALEEEALWPGILAMAAEFALDPEWLVPLCLRALESSSASANSAAARVLRRRIHAAQNPNLMAAIPDILEAVFMPRDSTPDMARLLGEIILQLGAGVGSPATSTLEKIGAAPGMSQRFLETVERIVDRKKPGWVRAVQTTIAEFFVSTWRVDAPGEPRVFDGEVGDDPAEIADLDPDRDDDEEPTSAGVLEVRKRPHQEPEKTDDQ
jgi:hypothetical protein